MTSSRRDFLKVGGIAAALALPGARLLTAEGEPKLGLIFPPLNYPIPPDAKHCIPPASSSCRAAWACPAG